MLDRLTTAIAATFETVRSQDKRAKSDEARVAAEEARRQRFTVVGTLVSAVAIPSARNPESSTAIIRANSTDRVP